jgi:hypothetical protein
MMCLLEIQLCHFWFFPVFGSAQYVSHCMAAQNTHNEGTSPPFFESFHPFIESPLNYTVIITLDCHSSINFSTTHPPNKNFNHNL